MLRTLANRLLTKKGWMKSQSTSLLSLCFISSIKSMKLKSIRRSLHPQFGRLDNLPDLSAKQANICLSLLVPCQISFAGDSLNLLTGVSQSME